MHIKPAEKKPPKVEVEYTPREPREHKEGGLQQSSYKQQKDLILKTNFDDETNWNYLYLNQDTVASSMAKQLGQQKGEFLSDEKGSMAVKLASSETLIINQTKAWLKEQCQLDFD